MGIKIRVSEITSVIIYYLLVITCCDIRLISCDIHQMRQRQSTLIEADSNANFVLNTTELEEHIMNGLSMKIKPDADLANISQEEFFTKYNEYLNKVNYRKRRSAKLFGDDITNHVYEDDSDSLKKIFAFKHSEQSNSVGSQRKRRSTREDEVTSLDFERADKSELPTVIEEATLNILLTNNANSLKSETGKVESDSESDYDDSSSSSSDISPKKLILKSNTHKSHTTHIRHHHHQHSNRNHLQIIKNGHIVRLHVYQHDSRGRTFLFNKDITLPINSDADDATQINYNKWIQLDLTSIVRAWLQGSEQVLSIDVYCEQCSKHGISIVNKDASQNNNPALNVIGAVVRTKRKTNQRKNKNNGDAKDHHKHKKTFCRQNGDKKCCRHKWVVDFKELGGYDYIIQPRHFDAGFCQGSCPLRHNMGSNHAYFQSLAHHHLKKEEVPNVCCAPTRLVDMEVLHIDENDHTKLKVTTMKKMRAMKCSCT